MKGEKTVPQCPIPLTWSLRGGVKGQIWSGINDNATNPSPWKEKNCENADRLSWFMLKAI
jgi:hypothetical protein